MPLQRIVLLGCVSAVTLGAQQAGQTSKVSQALSGAATAVPTLTMPATAPDLLTPPEQLTAAQIERMQSRLRDWAQLARYRDENAKLSPPAKDEQRVVFLGDSITDGWGHGHAPLFFPGKPYLDRGIGGQTTGQMLVRFRQDVISLEPAAVVILAGINDIAGNNGPETLSQIEDNFRAMTTLAKAAHIRVVLCSVLPASYFPWHKGVDPTEEVRALNRWLQGYAVQERATYLDFYTALVNSVGGMREELAADKAVHPNDAGYRVMQPLAEAAIRKALSQPRP